MNLPPPVIAENTIFNAGEQVIRSQESLPAPAVFNQASNGALPTFALPVPTAPLPSVTISNVTNTTNSSNPGIADDTDLIEKEWVSKAKEIVKKTQNDPHEQSKEINIFKADYMQKRYNKVLKLSE